MLREAEMALVVPGEETALDVAAQAWLDTARSLPELATRQQALIAIEGSLNRARARVTDDTIDITPRHARRMLADGWLDQVSASLSASPDLAERALAVADAARVALTLEPVRHLALVGSEGTDGSHGLTTFVNAYGDQCRVLHVDDRLALEVDPPQPVYQGQAGEALATMQVVVDVDPSGVTARDDGLVAPLAILDAPATTIALRQNGSHAPLLAWSPESGLTVNGDWRAISPDRGAHRNSSILSGVMPPHLAIATPQGHMRQLIVQGGAVAFPESGAADVDFLDHLAEQLDSLPELALYGEYAWEYVFDTPDSSLPALVGSAEYNSDMHSTASQSIATMVGGVCRGDCDDLAEFYQAVLDRQVATV